jgi:glycosyltransferase involved in cell wall biosynthesis
MSRRLVICAKSPWRPAVRREHALAQEAAAHGHAVAFVEQPSDVRALRSPGWARGLRAGGRPERGEEGVAVVARSVLVPGHRGAAAQRLQAWQLRRTLERVAGDDAAIVGAVPWDWPAIARAPARRRAFDMADDWGELMPGRASRFAELYRRITDEADAIVVVNEDLRRHFPGRDVQVIRNAVPSWMVGAPGAPPAPRRMVYVGTLSPRFDAPLVGAVLDRLPGWELDLVGPCLYPGRGTAPDGELEMLLGRPGVRWHGPLARAATVGQMDAGTALIVPNRPERSVGQDSMKLYDYAARGRPIVSTRWHPRLEAIGPPHLLVADDPEAFAGAVAGAADDPPGREAERRAWAAGNTWSARFPAWRDAVLGEGA